MDNQSFRTDDCIDEVIATYGNMVYRLAFASVKTKADADDLFQEVFLRYIRKKPVFHSEEHRKAWLIRVTVNCCKTFFSSAWRKKTVPLQEDSISCPLPEETGLREALLTLPPKYRIVLHLFYYEEMSTDEISQLLRVKPSTVRMQLTRGRALLKEKLKGDY